MAGSASRAVGAGLAAGADAFLTVTDQTEGTQSKYQRYYCQYAQIRHFQTGHKDSFPEKLLADLDFLREFFTFLILLEEQHVQHAGKKRKRHDQTKDMDFALKSGSELIVHQTHRVGKQRQ